MDRKLTSLRKSVRAVALAFGFIAAQAQLHVSEVYAADAQPRDFLPAPAGTDLFLVYYNYSSSNSFVDASGNDIPGSGIDTNVAIARYVHFFDVGGMLADINVVQPFGGLSNMSIGGADLSTDKFGLGDTSLVATIWPINDPERNLYFAVATYLTLPTGEYHADVASLGSNRWSMAVQPAFYFDIAPKWSVDLVGDITIYGDNNDGPGGATIKKDPSFTGLFWLNFKATDVSTISAGVSTTYGGEEKWDGVGRGESRATTLRIAWSQMITPTLQGVMQVGTDVDVENGFKNNVSVLARLAKFF